MSWCGGLPRRTFLKGVGAAIALPMLDAMRPALAAAAETGAAKAAAPCRMAFVYVPNGIHMPDWTPKAEGAAFDLPANLQLLEPFRRELLVLSGLTHDKARDNGDGAGDHARAAAAFLTGVQPRKTYGADIRAGVSVDQIAARTVGHKTPFASLELGSDPGMLSGECDSGYSCAYSSNISWRAPSTPMPAEVNPRALFERLFAGFDSSETAEGRAKRQHYNKSILDFVLEESRSLDAKLGATDRRKVEEYLYAIREIEGRIQAAERGTGQESPKLDKPAGIPDDYGEHIRLMYDLLAVAFQADMARISTFLIAKEGSNRSYAFMNVPEGHHDLSHHGGDPEKQAKISKINHFHLEQFAHFLGRLKAIPDGDGTLLDHVMIVYGSGIGDGNAHNHDDLPVLLAGGGCETLRTGRHVRYAHNTPMNNLYLAMLERMEVRTETLGDSNGRLEHLTDL